MGGQVKKPLKIVLIIVGAVNLIIGIAIVIQFFRELGALSDLDEAYNKYSPGSKRYQGGNTMMWGLVTPFLIGAGCIALAFKNHIAISIATIVLAALQIILLIVMIVAINSRWIMNFAAFASINGKDESYFEANHDLPAGVLHRLTGIYNLNLGIIGPGITASIVAIIVAALSLCKRCTDQGGFGSSGSTATF